jgi:dihydrofolate reductase
MRKIVAALFVSIDGVIDAANEFTAGYMDEEVGAELGAQMAQRDTMLLGRQTYQEFAAVWPGRGTDNPVGAEMNNTPKLVVSRTLESVDEWQNSTLLKGDPVEELNKLKQQSGKNILIVGSATLAHSLLRDGVVDELVLLVFPVIVGPGKRLFEGGRDRIPLALTDSQVFANGVVKLVYKQADQ